MSLAHYRLSTALAASLWMMMLAACGSSPPGNASASAGTTGQPGAANAGRQQTAANAPEDIDTEATILTVLGLAKKPSQRPPGPSTGSNVSPVLWQAAVDTMGFAKFASADPLGGSLVTDWYSPPDKPDERFRIDVFILSRHLTSDSVAVTVERQVRQPTGEWTDSTVDKRVQDDLETRILFRARQLKRAWTKAASS
jgi:Domain of unknown function (DUF3576)